MADYDRKELKPLQFTRNDVVELHRLLVTSGYSAENIVLMHDDLKQLSNRRFFPEATKIREELALLLAGMDRDDTLIVAFSGHGVQFKGEKESYFCPADSRLEDRATLIALNEIYAELEKCPAGQKLLLVDACRDDPQSPLSKSRQTVELESVTRPQADPVPEGLIALFSCAAGQRSFEDPELKHGVFFHHVLAALRGAADDGDKELTLDEMISFTKKRTQTFARANFAAVQTPQQIGEFTRTWVLRTLEARPAQSSPDKSTSQTRRPDNSGNGSSNSVSTVTSTAEGPGQRTITNGIGMELVRIPAGEYLRGSPYTVDGADFREQPQHRVRISKDFFLGVHEVTQRQWKDVMKTEPWKGNYYILEGDDFPATFVNWNDANEFCRLLHEKDGRKYRLPTEAEWEYACRAGTTTEFYFGDNMNGLAEFGWYERNAWDAGERYAHQVGLKKPNAFGLFDMHGNVMEWCAGRYNSRDYRQFASGRVVVDPQGPSEGWSVPTRGGGFQSRSASCRSAYRIDGSRASDVGFRVAADTE